MVVFIFDRLTFSKIQTFYNYFNKNRGDVNFISPAYFDVQVHHRSDIELSVFYSCSKSCSKNADIITYLISRDVLADGTGRIYLREFLFLCVKRFVFNENPRWTSL